MIKISISRRGYSVRGHAKQAELGYDVVCSAVSALTQTVALTLKKEFNANVSDIAGVYEVEVRRVNKENKLLLRTLVRGLREIEKEYPKHLSLRIQRGVM